MHKYFSGAVMGYGIMWSLRQGYFNHGQVSCFTRLLQDLENEVTRLLLRGLFFAMAHLVPRT